MIFTYLRRLLPAILATIFLIGCTRYPSEQAISGVEQPDTATITTLRDKADSCIAIGDYRQATELLKLQISELKALETTTRQSIHNETYSTLMMSWALIFLILLLIFIDSYVSYSRQRNRHNKLQLEKLNRLKEKQYRYSNEYIEENRRRIEALQQEIASISSANSELAHELSLKQMELNAAVEQAQVSIMRRQQSESELSKSSIYMAIRHHISFDATDYHISASEWATIDQTINDLFPGFKETLFELHNLSQFEYRICLLLKMKFTPIEIARLTNHEKSSVSSSRSRLFKKLFGCNGSTKDLDAFIMSL